MKIDLKYEIADAHVHIGECSITGLKVNAEDIKTYLKRYGLTHALIFSLDINYMRYNHVLNRLLSEVEEAYGLVRVQLDFHLNSIIKLLKNPKFLGVKFHPSFDRTPVTDQRYKPLFDWLENHNKLALIHCGRWKEVSHYSFAFKIADAFPNINMILAHMGGNEFANAIETIKLAKTRENIYLDTSNCRLPLIIEQAVKNLGAEKILLGSDMPWGSCLANVFTVVESDISEQAKEHILGWNFRRLLVTLTVGVKT